MKSKSLKLSERASVLINNTIEHTRQLEKEGAVPFISSLYWQSVLEDPSQHPELVASIERQASELSSK